MVQDTTTALDNLATATTTNRNKPNNLTKKIADQSSQITTLTNKLLAATEAAAKLKNELATIKRYNGHSRRVSGGRGDKQTNSRPRCPLDPNGCFWTHGFRVSCDHTRKSCNTKKPGHKYEATCTNTMG